MSDTAVSDTRTSRLRVPVAALGVGTALLAGAAAALGVFTRGDGSFVTVTSVRGETYEMATTGVYANNALQVVAEGVGWDVFTLFAAVPAMLLAAVAAGRESPRAPLIVAGLFGYFAYLSLEYAVTWAFGPLFPAFVVLLAGSVVGLILSGKVLADEEVGRRFDDRFPRRTWAALSIGMSVLLTVMWAGRIAAALGSSAAPDLHGETTMTVQALDLGLVVPASIVIAVAAVMRVPAGLAAAASFGVMFVAMSMAIAAMMVSSWVVTGVPAIEPIVIFGAAGGLGLLLSIRMLRSLDASSPERRPRSFEPALHNSPG